MVIAHVGGVPVEELVPTLAGAGTGVLVARAWLVLRVRRLGGRRSGEAVLTDRLQHDTKDGST